ncbi:bifunctional riboflavin kinase/FMN phosphatase, partial [Tanacetum coccineum]
GRGCSLPKQSHLYTEATEVINSLLDLRIDVTLPLEPWHIGGPVIKGYGRGSKVLGIPTFTNLSVEGCASVLAEHPAGVYFGWAKLSTRGFYKMAMSIELLHKFDEDFYGEELHLLVVGYIRPEVPIKTLVIDGNCRVEDRFQNATWTCESLIHQSFLFT